MKIQDIIVLPVDDGIIFGGAVSPFLPAKVEAFFLPAIAPEPVAFIGGCWRVP